MAKPHKQQELKEANLSSEEMKQSILKIDRRISDLESFDVNSVNDGGDPRIKTLEKVLDGLLVSIFGAGTIEYDRYHWQVTRLNTASINMMHETPISEVREGLKDGIATAKMHLETIKKLFLEELGDSGSTLSGKALRAYEGLELHPVIEKAAGKLFHDSHYANAVEDAVKALNALVRMHSGIDSMDGSALMEYVFSPKNPILKFNALSDQSDIDEQKGFMMMLSGSVAGLRNPRAHKLIIDDSERALEFIAFVSLLAKLVENSTK